MEMNMTNLLWFFAVILLAGGNGLGGLFGGGRPPMGPPPATQTILGSLGRFVAWAGSGSQAVAGASA